MSPLKPSEYRSISLEERFEEGQHDGSDSGFCTGKQSMDETIPGSWVPFASKRYTVVFSAGLVFLGSCLTLGAVGILYHLRIETVCFQRHYSFSPVPQNLLEKYTDVRFNGTLDWPSPYRGQPSPAIDDAWDRLVKVKVMGVSSEELIKSGSDEDSVQIPEELGGGYMATLEITHQLHCLNFLRMASYWDYYKFKAIEFSDKPDMVRTHLDHCIEMLRQALICNSDVGVVSHRWVAGYSRPYPNFNVLHKCRNFDGILGWMYDKEVLTPPGYNFDPQVGEKTFPSPP